MSNATSTTKKTKNPKFSSTKHGDSDRMAEQVNGGPLAVAYQEGHAEELAKIRKSVGRVQENILGYMDGS
jgi:hypothetical protein